MSDFGPMATQRSKAHSSTVGFEFLNSYAGALAMRGKKVPRYGKRMTASGAANYPKIVRIGDELRVVSTTELASSVKGGIMLGLATNGPGPSSGGPGRRKKHG